MSAAVGMPSLSRRREVAIGSAGRLIRRRPRLLVSGLAKVAAIALALVLATATNPLQQATPVARGASVWSIETVDSAGFTGHDSSVALDATGNPHISYIDVTNSRLRYARFDGTSWQLEGISAATSSSSLALDAAGNPHISYYDSGQLKYARFDGAVWHIQTVATNGGLAVGSISLALDAAGDPHITYLYAAIAAPLPLPDFDLRYARFDGTAWQVQTVDEQGGVDSSLAIDGGGNLHVSYYDNQNGNLRHARFDGLVWHLQTVDSAGDVGRSTSLALDAAGNPRISYVDLTNDQLKYARFDGSAWQLEAVDSAVEMDIGVSAPASTSLALDAAGNPHVSYYYGELRYARWDGAAWQLETVDDAGNVGSSSALALDTDDHPHISYLDGTNGDLKYAVVPGPGVGSVDATVDVAQAAACLVVSAKAVSFGTQSLGAENVAGTPDISVTNCAEEEATILTRGTNASGPGAAWNLVPNGVCGDGSLGADNYRLSLQPEGVGLSTVNKVLETLGGGATSSHTAHIYTACPGSTGPGTIMSMQIIFTATAP